MCEAKAILRHGRRAGSMESMVAFNAITGKEIRAKDEPVNGNVMAMRRFQSVTIFSTKIHVHSASTYDR